MLTNVTVNGCYLEVEGPWTSLLVELLGLTDSLLSLLSRAFFKQSMYSCCDLANTCARIPSSHSFGSADKTTNSSENSLQTKCQPARHSELLFNPLQNTFNFCEQFLKDKKHLDFVNIKHITSLSRSYLDVAEPAGCHFY
jgi:hypothetical protein